MERSTSRSISNPASPRLSRHGWITVLALSALTSAVMVSPLAADSEADSYATLLEEAYPADGPGAAAIVMRDGEVLYRGARGMADLELGVALAPEHVFRLGSITKQFTAMAIMMLAEQGKLSVDDEITEFLPDYPTHGYRITVEHLLTHTSGIFSYTSIPDYMTGPEIRADLTTDELVDVFDEYEMDFAPGERWNYSNSGYVLLGAIIEKVSELSYSEYMQRHVFEPLGMENSHYGGSQVIPRRVEGYGGGPGGYANAPFLSMTQPHAAGSLLSTVDDLARWNAAVFGGELVKPESVGRMTRKAVLNDGEQADYGYGYQVGDFRGEPMIFHGGGIFGFVTMALWLPESKVYVAVLSNSPGNPAGPGRIARLMAAEAVGKPFPKRTAITLDAEVLADYVGVYRVDESATRSVILDDGKLYTQRSGSRRFEIRPHAEDAFFYEDTLSHLTFERDAEGRVTAMHFHPGGAEEAEVCKRLEGGPEEAPERETADVSPEVYDLLAGRYEIQPGFGVVISRDGDRIFSQVTGQEPAEVFPLSPWRYFLKIVEAEIEFEPGDDGRARAVTIHQGGQEVRAERVD